MNPIEEFWGWLRRKPHKEWILYCKGITREWCEKMLRESRAPRVASRVVLPPYVEPYLPARRKNHES